MLEKINIILQKIKTNMAEKINLNHNDNIINDDDILIKFANPLKRFFAYLIDCFVIFVISIFIISNYTLKDFKEYNELEKEKKNRQIELKLNIDKGKQVLIAGDDKNIKIKENKKNNIFEIKDEKINKINIKQSEIIKKMNFVKVVSLTTIFTTFLYHVILILSKNHATIGELLFNLTVVKSDGEQVKFDDVLNRVCIFMLINILSILSLFIKNNLTLHDILSKTRVIEIK